MSEGLAVHGGQVDAGEWWACTAPERPADASWTVFDLRCPRCLIAAHAATLHLPLWAGIDVRSGGDPDGDVPVTVAELCRRR